MMTRGLLISCSSLFLFAACGGENNPNAPENLPLKPGVAKSCSQDLTAETACGDSKGLTGEWRLEHICDDAKSVAQTVIGTTQIPGICPSAVVFDVNMESQGVVMTITDTHFKQRGKLMFNLNLSIPKDCYILAEQDNKNICELLNSDLTMPNGGGIEHKCVYGDAGCDCKTTLNVPLNADFDYSLVGLNGLKMALSLSPTGDVHYCIEGNDLAAELGFNLALLGNKGVKGAWTRVE